MFVDTHTHLNFKAFSDDWREVVDRAVAGGVEKMIVVGTDIESSKKAVQMAQENKALFASVGIHPHHAKGIENNEFRITDLGKKLKELTKHPRVVAIGEVGLDYHTYRNTKYKTQNPKQEWKELISMQKKLLSMQVQLARELNKPLIIHSRETKDEVLSFLLGFGKSKKGVFHCFDGSQKYLKQVLDAGFYVSFTGNITYSEDRARVASLVPLERLFLETDSPFMTPEPHRNKRNEPLHAKLVAKHHASSRGVQLSKVREVTTNNAGVLFGL